MLFLSALRSGKKKAKTEEATTIYLKKKEEYGIMHVEWFYNKKINKYIF